MAYRALYRVWRPQRFSEVVGQDQTVMALLNAAKDGCLSHAYLFAGPRGTGKTSVAKILAKAANCENPNEGEPCNQCSSCNDINNGNFMDVIEIDAASNRGIDEIRDLREKVRILPAQGKRKIYIIDEVHMLTTEAFNALLKTLEEPPESVVFILATTESHRIPATILSRCQKYNFHRLTLSQIRDRLQYVAQNNSIQISAEALDLISRRANGGMRDALGMLDQLHAFKENSIITRTDVLEVLGMVDDVFIARLLDAVLNGDIQSLVEMLGLALDQGKAAGQLMRESSLYLRDLLLFKLLGDKASLIVAGEASKEYLQKQAARISKEQILPALKITLDTTEKLRFSEGQRFLLEVAFLQIAAIFSSPGGQELSPTTTGPKTPMSHRNDDKKSDDTTEVLWNRILAGVKEKKIPTHALLIQGKLLGNKDDTVFIAYRKGYKFHKDRMEESPHRQILGAVLKEVFGRDMEVEFLFLDDNQYNDIIVKKAIELFGEEIIEIKD